PVRLLDHVLDVRDHVAGLDREQRRVGAQPLVLVRRDLDLLDAARVAALADERHRAGDLAERLVDLLDLLVDAAEDLLVASDPFLTLAHSASLSAISPASPTFSITSKPSARSTISSCPLSSR